MIIERASGITTVRPADPVYRVVLWVQPPSLDPDVPPGYEAGYEADEYQITEARDVGEVLAWAGERCEQWAVFVEILTQEGEHTAARLAGNDPTSGEPITFTAHQE